MCACETGWAGRYESGGKRSTDWGEWNRLQAMGVGGWGLGGVIRGQVDLHHSFWFLPPCASSRS